MDEHSPLNPTLASSPEHRLRAKIVVDRYLKPQGDILFASSDFRGSPGYLNELVLEHAGYNIEELRSLSLTETGIGILSTAGRSAVVIVVTVGGRSSSADLLREHLATGLDAIPSIRSDSNQKRIWIPLMGTGAGMLDPANSLSITLKALSKTIPRWDPFVGQIAISCPKEISDQQILDATEAIRPAFNRFGLDIASSARGKVRKPRVVQRAQTDARSSKVLKDDTTTLTDFSGKLGLRFDRIAEQIVAMVQEATAIPDQTTKPHSEAVFSAASDARLTLGLFAPWGAGKSTLIKELRRRFYAEGNLVITINPWKWDGKSDIHDHVALQVIKQFSEQRFGFVLLLFRTTRLWREYKSWITAIVVLACLAIFVGPHVWPAIVANFPTSAQKPEEVSGSLLITLLGALGLGIFTNTAALLLPRLFDWASSRILALLHKETGKERQRRLGADGLSQAYQDIASLLYQDGFGAKPFVFFFDDLDRCTPERIATVLDSVHSLTAAGCVVFLAFDEEYIVAALNAHFEKIARAYDDGNFGRRFLEKIVQISFRLPLVKSEDVFGLELASRPAEETGTKRKFASSAAVDGKKSSSDTKADGDPQVSQQEVRVDTKTAPLPEIKLKEIIGDVLDQTVEGLGLNIRQVKALSNTLKLYFGIAGVTDEVQARRLAAFVFADRFDPDWLDAHYNGFESTTPPIGANERLAKLLKDMIGNDKAEILKTYHLLGRRPGPRTSSKEP
jgi:hypothetical protein